jgi:ATP-binding cassette subfamily F protein 3
VEIHPGNLDDHLDRLRRRASAAAAAARAPAGVPAAAARAASNEKERRRIEAEARNAQSAKEKPLRQELAKVEARIAVLEVEDKAAQAALADPDLYQDFDRARPHMDAHRRAGAELEKLYARWEELQRQLTPSASPEA